jgi:hypothetical protein
MRAKEITSVKKITQPIKLWTASVQIKQPNYTGRIDATVTAQNAQQARMLMKAQYGIPDWQVGSVKEVK